MATLRPADPVDVIELGSRSSLFVTRPAIMHYMAKRNDLLAGANDLSAVIASGAVRPSVNRTLPLRAVADAHRAIEERRAGALVFGASNFV
jgi:NADPH2:quinone reductase